MNDGGGEGARTLIRQARREELDALSGLALRSKAVWGYSESFMAACRSELTLTEEELHEVFVLEAPAGTLGYSFRRLSEMQSELHLFVEPSALRAGHGRQMLADAIARVCAFGGDTLFIQGNPNATEFYRAVGALQVGVRESASIPGRFLPLFELRASAAR